MPAVTVVYLGGFGRSGSTLVERVLGSAQGWTNVGELVDLPRSVGPHDELCGCGVAFSRCPVWSEVGDLAFGGWRSEVFERLTVLQRTAARQRHLPGLLGARQVASPALSDLRSAYAAIYRAVADVTGSRVVVDASKGPALGMALAGSPDIDLRMLNVVRDPRAVAWSWSKHLGRPHATSGTDEMWRIPAGRSAAQWSALQLEVAAISGLGGTRSALVRYEDFIADPTSTLVRATERLGLPLAPADLPLVQDDRILLEPSHGLSGNPGRFSSGVLELRRDDSWSVRMTTSDRAVVTAITLPLLRAYGYPVSSRRAVRPVISSKKEQRSHT